MSWLVPIFGHGLFADVAAVVGDPFIVSVGQDSAEEADIGGLAFGKIPTTPFWADATPVLQGRHTPAT